MGEESRQDSGEETSKARSGNWAPRSSLALPKHRAAIAERAVLLLHPLLSPQAGGFTRIPPSKFYLLHSRPFGAGPWLKKGAAGATAKQRTARSGPFLLAAPALLGPRRKRIPAQILRSVSQRGGGPSILGHVGLPWPPGLCALARVAIPARARSPLFPRTKGKDFPQFFFFFFAEFKIFTCSRSRRRLFSLIYLIFGLSCDCVPYEKDFLVAFLLALPLLHIVYTELKRDWRVTLRRMPLNYNSQQPQLAGSTVKSFGSYSPATIRQAHRFLRFVFTLLC